MKQVCDILKKKIKKHIETIARHPLWILWQKENELDNH